VSGRGWSGQYTELVHGGSEYVELDSGVGEGSAQAARTDTRAEQGRCSQRQSLRCGERVQEHVCVKCVRFNMKRTATTSAPNQICTRVGLGGVGHALEYACAAACNLPSRAARCPASSVSRRRRAAARLESVCARCAIPSTTTPLLRRGTSMAAAAAAPYAGEDAQVAAPTMVHAAGDAGEAGGEAAESTSGDESIEDSDCSGMRAEASPSGVASPLAGVTKTTARVAPSRPPAGSRAVWMVIHSAGGGGVGGNSSFGVVTVPGTPAAAAAGPRLSMQRAEVAGGEEAPLGNPCCVLVLASVFISDDRLPTRTERRVGGRWWPMQGSAGNGGRPSG